MKAINPPLVVEFPLRYVDAPLGVTTIGRPRGEIRRPMLVSLEAYGAPDVAVVVNSPLQKVARRAAIAWARKHHYGPTRRITRLHVNLVY
jgi:hypothetical protein